MKSKSKKKYVLIKKESKKMKSREQSKTNERYNTIGDIKRNSKNKLSKKERENYFENLSRKKEILLKINTEKYDKESFPYNKAIKKINKDKVNRKYRDYPNLIKGVLGQAVYNNISNNTNYNEYIRYKPIGDFFKEQSDIPTRKITNNSNSLNISFNSKSDLIKKEKEKNDINNINNTYNIENELKVNADSIKSKNNDTLFKSGKRISPILSDYNNINKNKEIVSEYINSIKSNDKIDRNNKYENKKMNEEFNNVEIKLRNNSFIKEKIEIEKINSFNIKNKISNNIVFQNDEEIWKYLKEKMSEEKEKEYNENNLRYNYFTLIKKFQGKILYEIGLENDINKINSILEKENVRIENEPVLFVTKRSYNKLKKEDISDKEINVKINEIYKENELLKNNINIMKEEISSLNDIIKSLNEKIKIYEKEINSKDNIINKYQKEINEFNFKYIKNKENITFKIIKNEFFDLINIKKKQINEKNISYLIENFRYEYKNIPKKIENKEIKEIKRNYKTKENENKIKLEKKEEKKDIPNNMKDKINIFNKNNNNDNDIKKEVNIPNKIFLMRNSKKEETLEEKMKREERMNKALKRIKNKRKIDEENNKLKKDEKVKNLSTALESTLEKGKGKKLYIDLEYEKEIEKEKEENEERENS